MPQPLIPAGKLVTDGWNNYVRDWKVNLELSIRFLLAAAIVFVAALIGSHFVSMGGAILVMAASIAAAVITVHTSILMMDVILKRDSGKTDAKVNDALGYQLFWSFIFISILVGLATLGGFILFFLPGIWLAVKFSMSQLSLLEDGKKGTQAMSASSELVKGRWWGVFGRSLLLGIVVGFCAFIVSMALTFIVGLLAGFDKVSMLSSSMEYGQSLTVQGVQQIISGIVQTLFMPLAFIYQAKLFHSLKKSR